MKNDNKLMNPGEVPVGKGAWGSRNAHWALREDKEQFRLLEALGQGVIVTDPRGVISFWNQAATRLYGWAPEEMLGRNILEVVGAQNAQAMLTSLARGQSWSAEFPVYRKDGTILHATATYSPVFDGQDRLEDCIGLNTAAAEPQAAPDVWLKGAACGPLPLERTVSSASAVGQLELSNLIDVPAVQRLMEHFYYLVRIPLAILDLKGKVLVGVGWQKACTDFHRKHPQACQHCLESDTQLTVGVPPGEFRLYRCKNHMWDIASPLLVEGQHVGNIFSGQFLFEGEPLDYGLFRAQARQYGFDEAAYLAALEAVPRLSREALNQAMAFFIQVAQMLAQASCNNLKLARLLTERKLAEAEIHRQNAILHGLNRIFGRALSCATEQELGLACLEVTAAVTQSQFGFIAEITPQGQLAPIALGHLDQAASEMKPSPEAGTMPDAFVTCGLYSQVIRNAKGFFTNELLSPPGPVDTPPGHPVIQAFLGVPLFHDGNLLGMVGLANRKGGYRPEDLQAVESLSVAIVQTLLHKRADHALHQAQAQLSIHAQELEQTVAQRTAKLQESIAELEHFSYAITHDMRAPLRAVQGFSAIIEKECAGCQRASQEFYRRIQRAAHRMDQLITDSLNYSRIARQELPLRPVNLPQLLNDLVESYPNLQPDKAEIQIAPDLPHVLGNEAALTQCFSNLLGNAVKFAKPGVKPQIRVWADVEHDTSAAKSPGGEPAQSSGRQHSPDEQPVGQPGTGLVRIWVEDNGLGIPSSFQPRVFDMFQRAGNDREGTGIGLAIVRKIARRLGGEVGVESEEGKGSRFWVELVKAP